MSPPQTPHGDQAVELVLASASLYRPRASAGIIVLVSAFAVLSFLLNATISTSNRSSGSVAFLMSSS